MGWAAGQHAPRARGIFQSPDRSICSWDGRIDNLEDLLRQTGLPSDCPDYAIVLSLYQQKGVEGLAIRTRPAADGFLLCSQNALRMQTALASRPSEFE